MIKRGIFLIYKKILKTDSNYIVTNYNKIIQMKGVKRGHIVLLICETTPKFTELWVVTWKSHQQSNVILGQNSQQVFWITCAKNETT